MHINITLIYITTMYNHIIQLINTYLTSVYQENYPDAIVIDAFMGNPEVTVFTDEVRIICVLDGRYAKLIDYLKLESILSDYTQDRMSIVFYFKFNGYETRCAIFLNR